MEVETENYLKMDPDPFDDRNPSRNPNCSFGHMLKVIFKKEVFMQKVIIPLLITLYKIIFLHVILTFLVSWGLFTRHLLDKVRH